MGKIIKTIEDTEKFITINRQKLATELETHPEIYSEVAEISAEKMSIRDELKERRDRIWAESFLEAKKGEAKISDKIAETVADASIEFEKATREYLEAKREADIWWSKREAFQARTDMLKELSRIMATTIYSTVDVKESETEKSYKDIKRKMRGE